MRIDSSPYSLVMIHPGTPLHEPDPSPPAGDPEPPKPPVYDPQPAEPRREEPPPSPEPSDPHPQKIEDPSLMRP